MENRFLEMDYQLSQLARVRQRRSGSRDGNGGTKQIASVQSSWVMPLSAADRSLVILIENGGATLGIPAFVDRVLSALPGADYLSEYRQALVTFLEEKIKAVTDNLMETLELTLNRYSSAKPSLYGDVIVLRDGTASYQELKKTLISLSQAQKIIDVFILTHGREDKISVVDGINGDKIRAMKAEYGKALSIRSVYMMNCVGSSLNRAWLDAGAKVSAGSIGNNNLPEPTMYFFWNKWKAGQTFQNAVVGAYKRTIDVINEKIRDFVRALPIPLADTIASQITVENLDFVRVSAPDIRGDGSLTINSDALTFSQSIASSLATTVLPGETLRALSDGSLPAPSPGPGGRSVSAEGIELIKRWEGFRPKMYNDPVGHCTIGYGTLLHTGNCDGRPVEQPWVDGITEAKATELVIRHATELQQLVNKAVTVPLNQNQYDALVSFAYNVGGGNFLKSTLLRRLNEGSYQAVTAEIRKWTKARENGTLVDLPGLVRRRAAEAELFERPATHEGGAVAQSLSGTERPPVRHSYSFESSSAVVTQMSGLSYMQNPAAGAALIAGISVSDAAQIGLAAASVIQTQVSISQGTLTVTYDKAQRMLTNEARSQMPGSQQAKTSRSALLFHLAVKRLGTAEANIIIEWEGNPYGEIATPVIRRDLMTTTEWKESSATINITKVDRIPLPGTDPRTWPIVYVFEGSYDPMGNGHFEFSGEFEVNAFGGLKFNRHEVVSRSAMDWAIFGTPHDKVQRGPDIVMPVPAIPQEQIDYLRSKLP